MAIRLWARRLKKSITARQARPGVETLENRVVPSSATQSFTGSAALFANNQAVTTFLGDSFNASTSFGSIDHVPLLGKFGATADMSIGGRAGLDLDFTGAGGSVSSSYSATLNQNFTQPNSFGEFVQFTPGNTFVRTNSGSFTTTSPSFGYGASLDLGLHGSIGGSFYAFDQGGGGSFRFNGNLSLPLMSVNENDSGVVSLLGLPFVGSSPGLGLTGTLQKLAGAAENFLDSYQLYYGLSEEPPLQLKLNLSSPQDLEFLQDLQLQLGLPRQLGPYTVPKKLQFATNLGLDLGSLTEEAPVINLSSGPLQSGGLLTSSGQSNVAQLNIQAGPLAGYLLDDPELAALSSTVYVNLGPFNVGFTPLSFQIQPTLYASQTVTVTPFSQLTYNFSDGSGNPMGVIASLNGAPVNGGNPVTSVTFTPGKDTLGLDFQGRAITVTPTWTFQQQMHDVVNLKAGLQGLLKVGEMSVHVPGLGDRSFGPLYQKSFDFADTTLQSLFDQTTTIASQQVTLAPFTVGGDFRLSTAVTSHADGSAQGSGSLRFALLSANALNSSTPVVIQVPAGTYNLTLAPTGAHDGSAGNLVVTAPNVILVGAGAGQTIIDASSLGDRVLHVGGGSSVRLVGVTIQHGDSAAANDPDFGFGGGILQDAGSALELEGCAVQNNSIPGPVSFLDPIGGAGISSQGTLVINDSTISGNHVNSGPGGYVAHGGGIRVAGGSLVMRRSTVSGNTLTDSTSAYGGGLSAEDSDVTVDSCTFANNTADGETPGSTGNADGGGVYFFAYTTGKDLLIVDSTFWGNRTVSGTDEATGGGIAVNNSPSLGAAYLVNDAIAYNSAGTFGGGLAATPFVVLKNTIVADNVSTWLGTHDDDVGGSTLYSAGGNLIGSTTPTGAPFSTYSSLTYDSNGRPTEHANGLDPTDLRDIDPQLGTFGNHGGPTSTLPLLPGSPAIDRGGDVFSIPTILPQLPAVDQRGLPAPVGTHRDVGAVEYQYDLALSGTDFLTLATRQLSYGYTLSDSGPDPAAGATLTFSLPAGVAYLGTTQPVGWTVTAPAVGATSGTVTFTLNSGSTLSTGQSASFIVLVQVTDPPSAAPVSTTASIGAPWDSNAGNNQVVITVFPEEVPFRNAVLGSFTGNAALSGSDFPATVSWGDGSSNSTADGSGAVAVVRNPLGGFNVVGSHVYAEAGNYAATVHVRSVDGLVDVTLMPNLAVTEQALSAAGTISPPALTLTPSLQQAVLYHFLDPRANLGPADFQAAVTWGDGTSNTSGDGSGAVRVVADAAGGFDVLGTHGYGAAVKGALYAVRVVDSAGLQLVNPVLFHFTDGNPLATAADFSATVTWGDGSADSSADANPAVFVVTNPGGGFDVLGAHAYTQYLRGGTLRVKVQDAEGATAVGSGPVEVDYPLTAGALTLPTVQTEGDRVQNTLLFHFTDGDPQARASDFQATVLWGDGTDSLANNEAYVQANPNGGFDVYGSHTYGEVPAGATFGVTVNDLYGAMTGASATFSGAVADPAVRATGATMAGPIPEDSPTGPVAVATFTDPGGAEALSDYSASIDWGDRTPADSGTISYDPTTGTFAVLGNHTYARAGSYTITVTIGHDQAAAVTVTDAASVADVAVSPAGSLSLSTVYGQSTGTRTVATFTDPGGASARADYQATISWGDGSSGAGAIGYDTAAPFTFASNLPTGHGPGAIAVADLDGNGILDLVVANATDHSVQVFLGHGDGTFRGPLTYSLGAASPTALAVADLGNGHPDIVTANANTNTVSVLLGHGDGTFQGPTTLAAGTNPSAVALADLGNGHVDIVAANRGGNDVSVFVGNGDGTFQAAINYAAGSGPDGVAIGDANGDGKPDMVVADAGSDSASVLLGNGDGTLQAPQAVAVGSLPSAVALAHLTSSGHLDIVTANAGGDNVSVLLGNGNGTFQSAVSYAVGAAPVALLVTDTNGDGRPDVITANNGSNNVSVLAGHGDGTLGTATNYALGSGATAPVSIAVGDLDGAGVPDLVTANSLGDNLTLLLPPFAVTGSHSYSAVSGAYPYAISVTVNHGGTSASASAGTVAVTPAPLTITANNKAMTYGGTLPALTATFQGLVNGDTPAAVSGLMLATVPASSHVGSYAITASGATDGNYAITLVNGTLTITPAPLTIAADDKARAYGDPNPALMATYKGLVNGDTASSLTGSLSLTTSATQTSPVGGYPITPSGQSSNDYTITYATGTMTVNPAVLTVTANDASRIYGVANPAFSASYSGFKNGETLATSGVTGGPSLTTTAVPGSPVGQYPISAAAGTLAATNYSFAFTAGTLTITPAPLTASGQAISATAGAPFIGTVATFTNADPFGGASSYTAVITWGDGSSSAGVISGTGSILTVSGTHTYAAAGSDAVSVQISHKLGDTTTATTRATATVTALGVGVRPGQAAGIGFWHNQNGQALINNFNGGGATTALGDWLANSFANLFGNLAGKTNAQVAAYYQALFGQASSKAGAEVLATALNVYATTSSLGGTAAQGYGFTVDAYGLGASSYNVGSNGAAFGVANSTVLNVYQLLRAANARAANGVLYGGDATLIALAVNVFDGVNMAGGI